MGAITSNRKRGDECFSPNRSLPSPNSPDFHNSKKPRFSYMRQTSNTYASSSKNTASRIARYPEATSRFRREVLAPCRPLKFGSVSNLGREYSKLSGSSRVQEFGDVMGNVLSNNYNKAKKHALSTFRYYNWKKDKGVIDVDSVDIEPKKAVISEDSSIEEVQIIEDGQEGRSVVSVSDQRSREDNGIVQNVQEIDAKTVDSSALTESSNGNIRVENAEKLVDSLSLDRDLDDMGLSAYKKLLESVERRSPKLRSLEFQIELNEKRRNSLQLLRPVKEPVEEVPREPFVPLTKEEEAEIQHAFSVNRRKVLVKHEKSNIDITGEVLQCLRPGAWLNDDVINLYLELLKEREKRESQKFLKCHFFSTFFYKKLIGGRSGYDYKSVRRWTSQRQLGYELIECDKIFVPIHKEIHWCLAVINNKDEKFQYLDSLGGRDSKVLKALARYFVDEVKDKSGKDINIDSWKQEYVEALPEQRNGFDCGMFMIKYADFYSRGLGLCFNQDHMPYFRLRTAKEILRLRAD